MVTSNQPLTPDPWPGTQPTNITRRNGLNHPVPATAPSAPSGVTAVIDAANAVRVNWVAPASDGGSPITGYTISSVPATTTDTIASATPIEVLFTFPFVQGTAYTFRVHATNAVGNSPESAVSAAVTPNP